MTRPSTSSRAQKRVDGVVVEVWRLKEFDQLPARETGPARRDQLERVPGLGLDVSLGEVSAQVGAQRSLGQAEGPTELAVSGGWCSHAVLQVQ